MLFLVLYQSNHVEGTNAACSNGAGGIVFTRANAPVIAVLNSQNPGSYQVASTDQGTSGYKTAGSNNKSKVERTENGCRQLVWRLTIKHWVLAAILAGATIRLALAAANLLHPSDALTYVQADNYTSAAESMRYTHDTTDPVFVPGYIFLVAVFQVCFGRYAPAFLLLFECLIGTACIPMMYSLARRIGGEACGAATALLVAIDPLLVTRSSLVMTEAMYIPLLSAALLLFYMAVTCEQKVMRQWRLTVFSSVFMGGAMLVRTVGEIVPLAAVLALILAPSMALKRKSSLCLLIIATCFLMVLPLCWHNFHKYGHFAVSSSPKFNYAALVIGPAKRAVDTNDDPGLLAMWQAELGERYKDLPPFVLADKAAHIASRWAFAHPGLTVRAILKGQMVMLFAPDRSAWTPGLSCLRLSAVKLRVFFTVVALFRLSLCLLALYTILRTRNLFHSFWWQFWLVALIVGHVIVVGAAGEGRFIAPVSALIDLLAAHGLISLYRQARDHGNDGIIAVPS